MDKRKLLARIINNPRSVRFSYAVALVEAFGFHLSRVRGSHHLFVHPGIAELVNFQEVHGQANRTRFGSSSRSWNGTTCGWEARSEGLSREKALCRLPRRRTPGGQAVAEEAARGARKVQKLLDSATFEPAFSIFPEMKPDVRHCPLITS